jgi:hypothetical protein
MYSSLYNWAVCSARVGCFMDLQGDGIKKASKHFQEAAWMFEHLLTCVSQLPPGEATVDFSKEALTMNSNLCLAQAQYLFLRKATDAGMKPNVLAKIAAQVSVYFQKAFEANQSNQHLRAFDTGKFANILGYHAKYFQAQAYEKLAEGEYKLADEKAKGMGRAVTLLKMTTAQYDQAKPFVNLVGGAYKANFEKKFAEHLELKNKATEENKTVYYESEADPADVPKPDA